MPGPRGMTMRTGALFVILVAFAGPGLATARPAATMDEPGIPLRWSDVVRRLDDLPRLQEALARVRAAEAGVDAAGQVPNPEAEARLGRGTPRGGGTGGLEWGVGLTIPFDWVGPRGAEVRAARSEADASRQDARAVRRTVLGRLAVLFWRSLYDQKRVATLEEIEGQVARLAATVRLRVQKGESRPTELPRIEAELERVRLDLGRARSDARADRRELALVLGFPAGVDPIVEADASQLPAAPDRDEAIRLVLEAHPQLAAAQARLRAREAQVSAEKARRVPGFSVGGFYDRELDKDSGGGLLRVQLPVWNWNSGGIRRAEAERAAEERAAEAAARDLVAETGGAWERCEQGRDAAQRFEGEILPRADAAARAVERGFELGEVSLIDVLDARRVLLDARKDAIEAGLRARMECAALAVLTGEIDDAK